MNKIERPTVKMSPVKQIALQERCKLATMQERPTIKLVAYVSAK